MSPSANRLILGIIVVIAAIFVLRSITTSVPSANDSPAAHTTPNATEIPLHTTTAPRRESPTHSARTHTPDRPTTGVTFRPTQSSPPTVPVTGYIVDRFTAWSAIPDGYFAEGISLTPAGITLSGDTNSTSPRNGVLQSPPLPMRHPTLAAPAENTAPPSDAVNISLQISLSENGHTWSPWMTVERHVKPDGNRIAPPMQATLANADLESMTSNNSNAVNGPSIRYRLGISASGTTAPVLADVRVWKRETN